MAGGICLREREVSSCLAVSKRRRQGQQHTNDGDIVLGGLELPESDIDSDTTLTLSLQFVKNPGILEGALAQLSGFL
jgi:hypothetical protein